MIPTSVSLLSPFVRSTSYVFFSRLFRFNCRRRDFIVTSAAAPYRAMPRREALARSRPTFDEL